MSGRPAVVMNLFHTGLGIARSLGERGIPVIGLTAQHGVCGNFTRYAKVLFTPDSKNEPEELLRYLIGATEEIPDGSVIFPTRDDDVVFLDRYRKELEARFVLTIPQEAAVEACLDKWKTYQSALQAGVAVPRSWVAETTEEIARISQGVRFPCVLKPVAAHEWRKGGNWELVGGRKAIGIGSAADLIAEYNAIARAGRRVLIQEMVPGGDDALLIAGCYLDRESHFIAGFNTQKLVQIPEGFGTGCVVRGTDCPELLDPTIRLLQAIGFSGIAEVEYKRDAVDGTYKLIEINPRPWDQHRLGNACGVDLPYLAYCEHAGLPLPDVKKKPTGHKWIAEDAFLLGLIQSMYRFDGRFLPLLRMARGKRIFAIWSWKDPLPFAGYMTTRFIPEFLRAVLKAVWARVVRRDAGTVNRRMGRRYDVRLESGKSNG